MGSDVESDLSWRRLTEADFGLLSTWFTEPQVARWWNHEPSGEAVARDFGPSVRGEEAGEDLIVCRDGVPVALVQRSPIAAYDTDLADFARIVTVLEGAVELDYLVGDASLRGLGLGSRIIAAVVDDTWRTQPEVPCVLVAIVAANTASWRAVEKAGFRRIGEGAMEPDNPIDDPLHYIYRIDRPISGP
ncbi:GNAT family N-acetyltransferase [Rhodococcoides trifolii]|uniref:GNAT family N-acetyltransferase n=1 Tax=Rhodococcoides trifolii TaxID=908250 RepID=UPI001668256F|nr:GNAT family N-acetyltransferase [Rhodococcus trifolii]